MNLSILENESSCEVASEVFNMITQAASFEDKSIDVIFINDEPWFRAKDVAIILGFSKPRDAIRISVEEADRKILRDAISNGPHKYTSNQLNSTYINESGLYSLIMNSRLEKARKFKRWVTKELLPKIRKIGQAKLMKELEESKKIIEEFRDMNYRLHKQNKELLSFKTHREKKETIYIVSTLDYAKNGIYKIGHTKSIKSRNSSHNTTHVIGDKVKVLAKFAVNDSKLVEKIIHTKLAGILVSGEKEFFMCPFNLLRNLVEHITERDDEDNKMVDSIIEFVHKLTLQDHQPTDWTEGLDLSIFSSSIQMIEDGNEIARFDVATATDEQKREFVRQCIIAYRQTIQEPSEQATQIVWKAFQGFLISKLAIPKSQYRALTWRPFVKAEEETSTWSIKWR